jgi:hypothetical protein
MGKSDPDPDPDRHRLKLLKGYEKVILCREICATVPLTFLFFSRPQQLVSILRPAFLLRRRRSSLSHPGQTISKRHCSFDMLQKMDWANFLFSFLGRNIS